MSNEPNIMTIVPFATVEVKAEAVELVQARIERANKIARKVGAASFTMEVSKPFIVDVSKKGEEPSFHEHVIITVTGEQPKLPGNWMLVAVIDHTGDLPLVLTVPGQNCAEKHRGTNTCDHCGKARRRTETFVVRSESGEEKRVGRNCLADFLGTSVATVTALANYADICLNIGSLIASENEGCGYSHSSRMMSVQNVLRYSTAVINACGWISKVASEERGVESTSSLVAEAMTAKVSELGAERRIFIQGIREAACSEAVISEVAAALAWARNLPATSEFNGNMVAIASSEHASYKAFGTACYISAGYKKHTETLLRAARVTNESHFGKVGEKFVVGVTLLSAKRIDTAFGISMRYAFLTEAGQELTWFSSGNFDSTVFTGNALVRIKGTVKKHDTWNGKRQTMVTRVSLA